MLIEFRVENFKNFKNELILKLDQIRNYEFCIEAVKDDIVKKCIVYGMNGSGKTNLGFALFDISLNLTEKEKNLTNYRHFSNLENCGNPKFYYKFKFGSSYLVYIYEKDTPQHMVKEELFIDDYRLIYYDHINHEGEVKLEGAENLNKDLSERDMSFIKYIRNNTVLFDNNYNQTFAQFVNFVDNMLLLSLLEINRYQGFKNGYESISTGIIEKGKLKEFEAYLEIAGINYKLIERELDGQKTIFCDFNGREVNFNTIASRGTHTLALFYYWLLNLDKVSLVFIDEFDVFWHNKLVRMVVQELIKSNTQAIITAYNTSIIDNDLLRPDCYFNLINGKIESFANLTQKELRKAHNIEKMYRSGSFC